MSTEQQKPEHIWQADSPPSPLFWDQEKKANLGEMRLEGPANWTMSQRY
jgi:hypothetical protein